MAKFYPAIDDKLAAFIAAQRMFFVATAPRHGRINVSPKGGDCLRVLGPQRVAWLDVTGSTNETAAHLLDDGRVTVMFCAFDGPAQLLRLFGRARSVLPGDGEWPDLSALFPAPPGRRQIHVMEVESVQTSCGFGVPLYDYQGERPDLARWCAAKGEDGLRDYWRQKNTVSIDGLPTGLRVEE